MSDQYVPLADPSVKASLKEVSSHGPRVAKVCSFLSLLIAAALVPVVLHQRALGLDAPAIKMFWHLSPPIWDQDEPRSSFDLFARLAHRNRNEPSTFQFLHRRDPVKKAAEWAQAALPDGRPFWVRENTDGKIETTFDDPTQVKEERSNETDLPAGSSLQDAFRTDPFKEPSAYGDLPGASTGPYSARTFAMKSHAGPDGKVVMERYASSAAGNGRNGIHEARHMYSDSTGLGKSSHEQHFGGRSRMTVAETIDNKSTSSQVFRGMNEADGQAFDRDFGANVEHLPQRAELNQNALEQPLAHDFHNSALPFVGGARRKLAGLLDHDDFWTSPYHEAALPSYSEDEEDDRGFWASPLSTHHLLPLTHGIRYRIPMA